MIKKGDRVRYKALYYGTGVGTVVDVLEDHVAYGAPYSVLMDHALPGQPERDYFEAGELELIPKFTATIVLKGPGLDRVEVVESDTAKGLRGELYRKSFEQLLDEDDRTRVRWEIDNGIKKKGK